MITLVREGGREGRRERGRREGGERENNEFFILPID